MEEQECSLTLRITLDTANPDNAYLAAQGLVTTIEQLEAVEDVAVLSGVADDD